MRSCRKRVVLAFLAVALLGPPSRALDLYVDATSGSNVTGDGSASAPWRTIAFALTQTESGDVVHVAAGVYDAGLGESFPLTVPPDVEVRGAGIGLTTVAGGGANELVRATGVGGVKEPARPSLSRLTLTDCSFPLTVVGGPGPLVARVEEVEIAETDAGPLAAANGTSLALVLDRCLVRDCKDGVAATGIQGAAGSLVFRDGEVRDCSRSGAVAVGDFGGTAYVQLERTRVSNCERGLDLQGPVTMAVEDSLVTGCQRGAQFYDFPQLILRGSTIAGNAVGIATPSGPNKNVVELDGSIVWGNSDYDLEAASVDSARFSDTQPLLPGPGNSSVDPVFVDAGTGNFHLAPGSPLIDAGDPARVPGGTDADLDPRVLDGDSSGQARVDVGYDERNPVTLAITGPPTLGTLLVLDVTAPAAWFTTTAASLGTADIALGGLGSLLLDPFGAFSLGAGSAPWSGGLFLPPDPVLADVELHIQSLGLDLSSGAGSFSNRRDLRLEP